MEVDQTKAHISAHTCSSGSCTLTKKLSYAKSHYNTFEKEFYAIVQAVQLYRHFLFQHVFILFADREELKHLAGQDSLQGQAFFGGGFTSTMINQGEQIRKMDIMSTKINSPNQATLRKSHINIKIIFG